MKFRRQLGSFNIQRPTFDVQRPSAFTLLEVILAITITGFVLAAASSMLVSVSNIWADRQETNFFEDHVDGVAEFMQSCFTNAGTEVALSNSDASSGTEETESTRENTQNAPETSVSINTGTVNTPNQTREESSNSSSLLRRTDEPISWAQPPGFAGYQDPLINFKLKDTPPLLVNTDNAPVIGIDVFLYFKEDEGLSLLWYSILQEDAEDENDLRRTSISPYITSISYIYWDERFERWEVEEEPQKGEDDEFQLPRFVRLIFEYDGETKERTLSIPIPSRSALLF